MALSMLQDYETDSDDSSDDEFTFTVDKDIVNKKRLILKQNSCNLPVKKIKSLPPTSKPCKAAKPEKPMESKNNEIPLPASITAMFIEKEREVVHDDPALHDGRIRTFSHEKNNWASYVYVDLQDCELDEVKNFIVKELDLEPIDHHHLSISRVVSLRHHWIDPFTKYLKDNLELGKAFPLCLDKLQVYANDEKTRTFVGLEATGGINDLKKNDRCCGQMF